MLSTTATVGRRWRKLALNSHASATNMPLLPMCVLPPIKSSDPPMWMEGSMPHSMSTWESMEVVVVLPCAPHTPMAVSNPSISWPSSVARSMDGRPRRSSSTRSGLSGKMATV